MATDKDRLAESAAPAGPSRVRVWEMFDRIAPRYDLLNRLLSLRQDVAWRKRVTRYLPEGQNLRMLDLATGTGDQLFSAVAQCPRVGSGVGIDLSEQMLHRAREKAKTHSAGRDLVFQQGDAANIPFPDDAFDAVTISFGIRNVPDVLVSLREMLRVLRPAGRAVILECSLPRSAALRRIYLVYFRHVLPWIGGLLSGDGKAYRYLNETVETFPYGTQFCDLMETAGFASVESHPMTFGVATIYVGTKAQS